MSRVSKSLRNHLIFGGICSAGLVWSIGWWATSTELSGAVVAQGTVAVEGQVKRIQHPLGGVVSRILVKEGQQVKEGDLLITLDETAHRSNMLIFQKQADEALVRISRLESEEKGLQTPEWPLIIKEKINDNEIKKTIRSEKELFDSRVNSLNAQRKQLKERIIQIKNEIIGLKGQIATKSSDALLIQKELNSTIMLEKQGYTTLSKVIALKRDFGRSEGERDNLKAEADKSSSKLVEAEVTLARLDQDNQRDISLELRDIKTKLNEVHERYLSAEDLFKRSQIKAPHNGIIHQLTANTIGGVVQPGEAIMTIVPDNQPMVIEAKIAQSDIDQVKIGENALIRFTAFNQRTTPEINGNVTHVSADLTKDRETNSIQQMPYYTVRMNIPPMEMAKLQGKNLQAGMGAEVFIHTETRSVVSYFIKPFSDQLKRAFKER